MKYFKQLPLFIFTLFVSLTSLLHSENHNYLLQNIELMGTLPTKSSGMDIIIVCANTSSLVKFWEKRLEKTKQYLLPPEGIIICVEEDWADEGAGNGLGTLYCFQKARLKAQKELGIDILEQQAAGAAIAMYHTAGMGKRLAPLTVSKFGIKSAVELPGLIDVKNTEEPILFTLLEATIKQSMVFGSSRKGRLSVFWSDQIFIPSNPSIYTPESHIDILVKNIPLPTRETWNEQSLQNYGLVTWVASGEAKLFDKCDYDTFQGICENNSAISEKGLAISMGSFSLSLEMITALLEEFKDELNKKTDLLDSDPYFWMPMTLDLKTYSVAMEARLVPSEVIEKHYERMQRFKQLFLKETTSSLPIFFSGIDIGNESYWWDYGTVDAYFKNNILMTQKGFESELMRAFYNLSTHMDDGSIVIGCNIKRGALKNSIAINFIGEEVNLENSIVIGGSIKSLTAESCLGYYIQDTQPITLSPHSVRADHADESQHIKLIAPLNSDGKKNWKSKLPSNDYSWKEAMELVSNLFAIRSEQ